MSLTKKRYRMRRNSLGVEIFTWCETPFEEGGALFGMVPIEPDESLRETLSALRRSLRLSFKALAQWQIGLMPDGRIAVVDPRGVPIRCAISRRIHPRRVYRAVPPVEPLPVEVAKRLLDRMFRHVDWDSLPWDAIEREREQEQQRLSRSPNAPQRECSEGG